MKVVSPEIIHKSDSGEIVLNIESMKQLQDTYLEMKKKFSDRDFRGVLLYEQIKEGVETIVGMKRDPLFGPVIIVEVGGIPAELIRDISIRIAPVAMPEAMEFDPIQANKL